MDNRIEKLKNYLDSAHSVFHAVEGLKHILEEAGYTRLQESGKWELVREQYRRIKNRYLSENDHDHPSFVCYVEAVSNVYNSRNHW